MQVTELQLIMSLLLQQCVFTLSILQLLKIRVAEFKCRGHFIKKVYSHNFASKIRLIYFSHFPEILV